MNMYQGLRQGPNDTNPQQQQNLLHSNTFPLYIPEHSNAGRWRDTQSTSTITFQLLLRCTKMVVTTLVNSDIGMQVEGISCEQVKDPEIASKHLIATWPKS